MEIKEAAFFLVLSFFPSSNRFYPFRDLFIRRKKGEGERERFLSRRIN